MSVLSVCACVRAFACDVCVSEQVCLCVYLRVFTSVCIGMHVCV